MENLRHDAVSLTSSHPLTEWVFWDITVNIVCYKGVALPVCLNCCVHSAPV